MAGAAALNAKRDEAIAQREEERRKKLAEVKAAKAVKVSERAELAVAKEAELRAREELEAKRAEVARKRENNIAKKEEERKARADALKERKGAKQKTSKYSKPAVLALKQVFDKFDVDKSGSITVQELNNAVDSGALADATFSMLKQVDSNNSGTLSFNELLRIMYPLANADDYEVMNEWAKPPLPPPPPPKAELTAEQLAEIETIFAHYDKDGSDGIGVDELKSQLQSTYLSAEDIEKIFAEADVNGDQTITLDEFRGLMESTGMWTPAA